jgi:hypothetical protein
MRKSLVHAVFVLFVLLAGTSVSAQPAADPNYDGAMRGAAIGAAVGLGSVALLYATLGDDVEAPGMGGPMMAAAGVGGGAGALIGYLLDRAHRATPHTTSAGPGFTGTETSSGFHGRHDTVANGAIIGAAIGAGFAIADYAVDPSEPGNAQIAATAVGVGALVGAGIDALLHDRRAVTIAPAVTTRSKALWIRLRF